MTDQPRDSRIWMIPWIGGAVLVLIFIGMLLLRIREQARMSAQPAPVRALRVIASSQSSYYQDHFDAQGEHEFASSLDDLTRAHLVPHELEGGRAGDYVIHLERPARSSWWATAAPATVTPGADRAYFVDDTSVIRVSTSGPATATSTAIGD